MSQSLRLENGIELANTFLNDLQFRRSKYYYFLGGVEPWNGIAGETSGDIAPSTPLEQSQLVNNKYRSEIAFVKLISPGETSLTCRRIDWETGTVYDHWDHTVPMIDKNFYVMTDDFNVYKCLDNDSGAPSTVKPSGTSIYPVATSDGYLWKYMYNVPAFKRTRFMSVGYMPVQRATSDSFYNNGKVEQVVVTSEGSGYTDQLLTQIGVATNTTVGTGAVGTVVVDGGGVGIGAITGVNVGAGTGTGYTKGVRVVFHPGTSPGTGASATAIVVGGVITGVTMISGGVGYDPAKTTVTFEVGGAQLLPLMSRTTGGIVGVKILDAGTGYNTSPALSVTSYNSTGQGAYGNATAILQCVVYNGSIQHVNIIDPGKNYPVDNATTIVVQGDGTGSSLTVGSTAKFSPVIYDGRIIEVIVEDPGIGYTEIKLTIQSATGVGGEVQGVITQSDYISNQMIVEQTSVKGAIYKVQVVNTGANYTMYTTCTITGNGTGATATPIIQAGKIVGVRMTDYGSNYTFANITFNDPGRPIIPNADKASAYAILPPNVGHGANAPLELYGNTVSINSPLRGELEVEGVVQEYRNFGIIKNPNNLLTGSRYSSLSSLLVYKMRVNTISGMIHDDILSSDSNNRYRILEFATSSIGPIVYLIPLDHDNVIPTGSLVSQTTQLAYNATSSIQSIDFDKYSGTLLYISTENPFDFSEDQSITIKTFIKF